MLQTVFLFQRVFFSECRNSLFRDRRTRYVLRDVSKEVKNPVLHIDDMKLLDDSRHVTRERYRVLSSCLATRKERLLVGATLHDTGELAVVEFASGGLDLVEHLGDLSLGGSVGLDTTGAEEGLDGIDVHLAGGGWVEQVPSGHDGLLGVGSGHLLSEKLEEHLEVEGAGGLGDHGAQSSLVSGLAHDSIQSDKVIDLNDTVSILIQESEDLLELFDLSLIEHLEGLGVGAWVRRG